MQAALSPVPFARRWAALGSALALAFSISLLAEARAAGATAEPPAKTDAYVPDVGQDGKDVIWVPTPQALVDKMLDMARVTPRDRLMDLGSGDGRTVITAAQRGLRAKGIEYNPDLVTLSRSNAAKAGVADRATFEVADLFETDLSQADVITMFLLSTINEKLRPRLLELAPGTRIVSNTFRMGDWEPDASETVTEACQTYCNALLWIVPAKVGGQWDLDGRRLLLEQRYQMLTGKLGGSEITDARMDGRRISFSVDGVRYTGEVDGNAISGNAAGKGQWSARRI